MSMFRDFCAYSTSGDLLGDWMSEGESGGEYQSGKTGLSDDFLDMLGGPLPV